MQYGPLVISNVVIFQYSAGSLSVLLTSDGTAPNGRPNWHLPSAPVGQTQTTLTSLETTLRTTIGLQDADISYREQLYTLEWATSNRTTVCVSYMYLSRSIRWLKGTQQVGVFPIDKLPRLTQDNQTILRYALDRLHAKTLYSTILSFLLPKDFDLTELQQAFEAITHQHVDRRNFRKKFLALDVLKEKPRKQAKQSQPTIYSFNQQALEFLAKPFPMRQGDAEKRSRQ